MLYIEKQQPDKELLARIAEVKSSSEWKQVNDDDTKGIRECFDKLPKDVLRQSILKEQHHLCAYCMKRINDSPLHTTIEHWYPLSKDKNSALDYNNMNLRPFENRLKILKRRKRWKNLRVLLFSFWRENIETWLVRASDLVTNQIIAEYKREV